MRRHERPYTCYVQDKEAAKPRTALNATKMHHGSGWSSGYAFWPEKFRRKETHMNYRAQIQKILRLLSQQEQSILDKAGRPRAAAISDTSAKKPKKGTIKKQTVFLRAFAGNFSITTSARLAGIDRTTHYDWLLNYATYKAKFERILPMAADAVEGELFRRGVIGVFEPHIYKGQYCYAARQRIMCTLADGTFAFEDELPKDAEVTARCTVTTRDGERLGTYRKDVRALLILAAARMPEKYGNARQRNRGRGAR